MRWAIFLALSLARCWAGMAAAVTRVVGSTGLAPTVQQRSGLKWNQGRWTHGKFILHLALRKTPEYWAQKGPICSRTVMRKRISDVEMP
ncbi:hypothetical protein BJY52DRAFT_1253628 [Lactarius psammicola]|nr:hypothetical protein BJY52DRAFT_1253628 [Lactarius psammicola]